MDNLVHALADQLAMQEQLQLLLRYMLFICIAFAELTLLILAFLYYLMHRLTKLEKEVNDLRANMAARIN